MEKIQPGKYVELGYDLYEVTPEGEKLNKKLQKIHGKRQFLGYTLYKTR